MTTAADNVGNPPAGSLRAVLTAAQSGDTIVFAPGLIGQTITLRGALPAVRQSLTITGPGAANLTISGNGAYQIFTFFDPSVSSLSGLTLRAGSGPHGGAIYNFGTLTASQLVIADGTTYPEGGGGAAVFNAVAGTLNLTNSLLENNTTFGGNGGAVFNSGTMTVANTTVTGNRAVAGGGIANAGTLSLVHDTVAGNHTVEFGSGGGVYTSPGYAVSLLNTVIATNGGDSDHVFGPDFWGAVTASSHSLIGDGTLTTGVVHGQNGNQIGTGGNLIDPHLSALQDNGGPTPTLALLPDSPAIDAGDTAGVPTTDQRGFRRVVNNVPDIGAYEYQPPETVTTLNGTPATSTVNQPVIFTATVTGVAPGSNTPTGTVTFSEGGTTLATVPLSGGRASYTSAALEAGTHLLTAHYNGFTVGDFRFTPSTSAPWRQQVNRLDSLTLLSVTPNPATVGQAITFTAQVSAGSPGAIAPTGTVTFFVNGAAVGTAGLTAGGAATWAVDSMAAGSVAVTATYNGDNNFLTSTSAPRNLTVNRAASVTALDNTPAVTTVDQAVTLTATVGPADAIALTPSGTVTFYDGSRPLGTAALNGTTAIFTTRGLGVGGHSLTAVYAGDGNFTASTSPARNQAVNRAASATALDNQPGIVTVTQPVTLTATVTPPDGNRLTPTGTVTFYDGGTALGTVPLNGRTAVLMVSTLGVGSHSLTAAYGGDGNFLASSSAGRDQTVSRAATAAALDGSPATAALGQPVTFTATVTPALAIGATPTGTVTFFEGGTALATVNLNGGTAAWTTRTLSGGTHTITATYNGDALFTGSSATARNQVVNLGTVGISVRSSLNPVKVGHGVTFTATVTVAGTDVAPTGTVTFYDGVAALGTVDLNGTQAVLTTSSLTVGRHVVTAKYNGDGNFNAAVSAPVAEVVSALGLFAIGGTPGRVQVRKESDGNLLTDFAPYGAAYTGGVTVAVGDVNGDGYPDLVTGAVTGNPHVKVFDGRAIALGTFNPNNPDASLLAQWFPYALQFNVGANVAVGYVSGNGYADVVTGATAGNPDVRVYSGKDIALGTFNPSGSSLLAQWFPYALQFNVGANVAVGDVNGDGYAEVVTGATAGNPDVRVYNGHDIATGTFSPDHSMTAQFFAYALEFNVGAFVAVGDTTGNGYGDIITGASVGNPHVRVISGRDIATGHFDGGNVQASQLDQFFAYDLQYNVGVAVAAGDFNDTGKASILTGATRGAPHFRVVDSHADGVKPPALNEMEGIPADFRGGIFVAA